MGNQEFSQEQPVGLAFSLRHSWFVQGIRRVRPLVYLIKKCRTVAGLMVRPYFVGRYLKTFAVRKLQLGAGECALPGWLNTDLNPQTVSCVTLDATRRLPFPDDKFDYVFTEHMIEHLSFAQGRHMLCEVYRVLRAGGKVRIATPDFEFLLRLCREHINPQEREYIAWAARTFMPHAPVTSVSVVNNFFRDWGHQYVYDQRTLSQVLSECGFGNIVRCEVGQSDDAALSGIESHGKWIGDSYNRLETFILEATKPPQFNSAAAT